MRTGMPEQQQPAAAAGKRDRSEVEEHFVDWLRDAHAAEKQSESMLTKFADRIDNYPELKSQIQRHIEETRGQAKKLEKCLEKYSGSRSTLKDVAGKMMGTAQALSGAFVEDEIVKGALASYAFEHMEIASYRILIAAADIVGDHEAKSACEDILEEEIAMASWLEENLSVITQRYLIRDEIPGQTAKH